MSQFGDDCYFYYYSSCAKGTSCTYRHCEDALGSEIVCTNWRKGKCYRTGCMFRHMEIKIDRRQIPCYWESQPSGCTKPHCVFKHYLMRDVFGNFSTANDSASKDAANPTQSIPDKIVPQKIEPVVVNPLEESDQESICSPQIKRTSPQEKPVEERPKVNALRRLGPRRIEDNFEKGPDDIGIKSLDKLNEKPESTPRATQERLKQIISQKKGHSDPKTNLDENIPMSRENVIMNAKIQAERMRKQPNADIVPMAVKRKTPENKCDKPFRKVVKCDNVKKVVPLTAATKRVVGGGAPTANTSLPPHPPMKWRSSQYSSEDENDNSSTGSEDSELNFKVKSLHEIRAEKKKRSGFSGKESSRSSVPQNESVTRSRISPTVPQNESVTRSRISPTVPQNESVTRPRNESVTKPRISQAEQKMKRVRQIYVPPAVRSQVDSHNDQNGLNPEPVTQAARKPSLKTTTVKPLLTKTEPPVSDPPHQSESDSLNNIKIKSFAEIMAEKRQRAQQHLQKPTECSASGPIIITDSSERKSLELASSNTAKKAPTLALWTRKKLAAEIEPKEETMRKPGLETQQQAASKRNLSVVVAAAAAAPQNSDNGAVLCEVPQPKMQRIDPPRNTRTLAAVKNTNISPPTRTSTRRAAALAATPPPPPPVVSKSAPEPAQTKPKSPVTPNPLPRGRGKRGAAAAAATSVPSPIPEPTPPAQKKTTPATPVAEEPVSEPEQKVDADTKSTSSPVPPTERSFSTISDGIFDDEEFDTGDVSNVGSRNLDEDADDVLRQLEEILAS